MLRREQIERLKERYPAGTVVRLGQMEGEHQMPSGMDGKVTGVDDIGQIHVEWENGSTLALNVEEDDFTVVPQKETLSEKKCREFLGKVNEILKETDFYRLNVSCNGGDTAYAAQKLLAMHQAFETVYGEGYVDEEYGMVMMPAVVCGRDSGIRTLALVTLDLESSGEHFGTIFMTPGGMMEQGSSFLSENRNRHWQSIISHMTTGTHRLWKGTTMWILHRCRRRWQTSAGWWMNCWCRGRLSI